MCERERERERESKREVLVKDEDCGIDVKNRKKEKRVYNWKEKKARK